MIRTAASVRAALACIAGVGALAACEQTGQTLPFDFTETEISREIPEGGATLSMPIGASVQFPAGSLPAGTRVSMKAVPALTQNTSGTVASGHAFQLDSQGTPLQHPARMEVAVDRSADAWLTSLVVVTPEGRVEIGRGSVDLARGIARGSIPALGTVQAVIPSAGAVFSVGRSGAITSSSAGLSAGTASIGVTRAIRGACGGDGVLCSDLQVEVSQNFWSYAKTASVIFPTVSGEIQIQGAVASGSLVLDAPIRAKLSDQTSSVEVPVTITAATTPATVVSETPGRVVLSNMQVRVQSGGNSGETVSDLIIEHDGSAAWLQVTERFSAKFSDTTESVELGVKIPLVRVQ